MTRANVDHRESNGLTYVHTYTIHDTVMSAIEKRVISALLLEIMMQFAFYYFYHDLAKQNEEYVRNRRQISKTFVCINIGQTQISKEKRT